MKKRWKISIKKIAPMVIIAAIGMSLAGCNEGTAVKEEANVDLESTTVEAYGVVEASEIREIVIDFPASLTQLHVKEGQMLKKGASIATLDLNQYMLQIQSKEIELKISGKEKTKILSETTLGLSNDLNYKKLQAAYQLALTNFAQAEKNYKNASSLLASGAISQSEYDQYKLNYEVKQNERDNLDKDIALYKKEKEGVTSSIGIKDLQATAENLSLEYMQAKLNTDVIQNDLVISPYESAVVYDIGYEEGALIAPSQKLCSLADLSQLMINADITEDFIAEVKIGAEVVIVPVADRSKSYHGKVVRIADMAKVENGETLIGVEIAIEDNDGFLKPNYNVDLSIQK